MDNKGGRTALTQYTLTRSATMGVHDNRELRYLHNILCEEVEYEEFYRCRTTYQDNTMGQVLWTRHF